MLGMIFHLRIAAAAVGILCLAYLLMSPIDRDTFFLTRLIQKKCFPNLQRDLRQKRMTLIAGFILGTLVLAQIVYFLITHFGNR